MITPRKISEMPPEEILRMYPCMDLDRYILEKVLEGPLELLDEVNVSSPMFSRNLGQCYPLLIMCVVDGDSITINVDEANFESAVAAGQMVRKNSIKTWCLSSGKYKSWGRTFPEAICKLAICRKFNIVAGDKKAYIPEGI